MLLQGLGHFSYCIIFFLFTFFPKQRLCFEHCWQKLCIKMNLVKLFIQTFLSSDSVLKFWQHLSSEFVHLIFCFLKLGSLLNSMRVHTLFIFSNFLKLDVFHLKLLLQLVDLGLHIKLTIGLAFFVATKSFVHQVFIFLLCINKLSIGNFKFFSQSLLDRVVFSHFFI